jgi:hypothetical protein
VSTLVVISRHAVHSSFTKIEQIVYDRQTQPANRVPKKELRTRGRPITFCGKFFGSHGTTGNVGKITISRKIVRSNLRLIKLQSTFKHNFD